MSFHFPLTCVCFKPNDLTTIRVRLGDEHLLVHFSVIVITETIEKIIEKKKPGFSSLLKNVVGTYSECNQRLGFDIFGLIDFWDLSMSKKQS